MTPYVYRITHKETGYYYIGSKYSGWRHNKEVTELIGEDYYTSSTDKFIQETFTKERVADWDIYIIYRTRGDEHDASAEVIAHENLFIGMHIDDELCLNKHYQDIYAKKVVWLSTTGGGKKGRPSPNKGKPSPNKGRKLSPETIARRIATQLARTPEQKAAEIAQRTASHARRTPEQKAATKRKELATRARNRALKQHAYVIANLSSYIEATK